MTQQTYPDAELVRSKQAQAKAILETSYSAECERCGRETWWYLIAKFNQQQVHRCAGCGCERVSTVQP